MKWGASDYSALPDFEEKIIDLGDCFSYDVSEDEESEEKFNFDTDKIVDEIVYENLEDTKEMDRFLKRTMSIDEDILKSKTNKDIIKLREMLIKKIDSVTHERFINDIMSSPELKEYADFISNKYNKIPITGYATKGCNIYNKMAILELHKLYTLLIKEGDDD